MNKKAQGFFGVLLILVIVMVVVFVVGAIIIKNVYKNIDSNDNKTINQSDFINGSLLPGNTREEKAEMAKDPNILPPELNR